MSTVRRRYLDTSLLFNDTAKLEDTEPLHDFHFGFETDPTTRSEPTSRIGCCSITFYLPDVIAPLVVRDKVEFVVGRVDVPRRFKPTVDLSEYDAQKLGVSRRHASIIYQDDRFYIQDLNSKNGTWVNYIKLESHSLMPIKTGDIIQLGYLTMRVG